jgi:hypothetical protein
MRQVTNLVLEFRQFLAEGPKIKKIPKFGKPSAPSFLEMGPMLYAVKQREQSTV